MTPPHSTPTRSLPDRPSLAQLRKQAKELLKSYRGGEDEAVREVERFEADPDPAKFALADAQRVLARAYGFSSWASLKTRVAGFNRQLFFEAVAAGDVASVREMGKAGPELVNAPSEDFSGSPLHVAVFNRDAEMTRVLMRLGADARKGVWPYRDATTAYAIAEDRELDDIVKIIEQEEDRCRKEHSSPGATISDRTDEVEKAILADRWDAAMEIIESDLSLVGACNKQGATPLHIAAWKHNPEMVAWLLDRGGVVDAQAPFVDRAISYPATENLGKTPLDFAAIVAGWAASDKYFGWSATDERFPYLENARIAPARFHETVRLLRSKGAALTPGAAVAIGDLQTVMQLHRQGQLKNEIHVLRGGLLAIAVRVGRIDMVSLLLDLGLDPDESIKCDDGESSWGMPLWFAAMCGRHDIARLLLSRGADVNGVVYASGDPLGNAYATRDEKMQALLLEHGARLTVERVAGNQDRETAQAILDGSIPAESLNVSEPSHTELAEQMLWASARCDPEIVRMCLPHMKRTSNDPWWAYVLMSSLPESVHQILDHGVDPDVVGEGDSTPLQHLATDYVDDQHRLAIATMLLDAGASLTRRDSLLKSTPLGWACRYGRVNLAELYLKRGANAQEPDAEPWATPMAWAVKGGNRDIIELLKMPDAE